MKGYCLKERKHVDIVNPTYELNKIGRPVARGTCSSCGGKVQKLLNAVEAAAQGLKAQKKGSGHRSGGRKSATRKSPGRKTARKSAGRRK